MKEFCLKSVKLFVLIFSWCSYYLHLYQKNVTDGQSVTSGQVIGISGDTGSPGAPHLHFEIRKNVNGTDVPVDPYGWAGSSSDPYTLATNIDLWASLIYVSKDGTCGGNSPCYTTIQDAINAATTGAIIRIAQGTYTESITLSTSKSLTLKGGWNSAFTSQTPNTTIIKAPKANQGSLTLQMVTIRP